MAAIIENTQNGQLNAEVALVISNKPDAAGLKIAAAHNIPTHIINAKEFENKDTYEAQIVKALNEVGPDLVILAGYLKIVGKTLLNAFPNKMLNIHPSLLPAFKGLNAQKQALEAGVKISGCTVHWVTEDLDGGPIIAQSAVPVKKGDTEDTLSARILVEEHKLYSNTIKTILESKPS